jgi:quinol monooxygenase YgiN
MSELPVVAIIPVKPERAEEFRGALGALAEASRGDEGCLSYDVYESAAAPGVFVTVERWSGQESLDAHMRTPHIAAATQAAEGALTGDIAIHPLVPVSVSG